MKLRDKIDNFKEYALRGKGTTLSISSDELNLLDQEYRNTYNSILSNLSFLEKNWLGFMHYKIGIGCISSTFNIQPIWVFPFLRLNVKQDIYFCKNDTHDWYESYILRSVSYMKVPVNGLFDESLKISGESEGFIEFLLGSSKLKGSTFELCKRGVDYISILNRNSEEKELIKKITSRIKNIEIENNYINIDV
ncbi:MAG: hypothetical protein F6K00_23310 [Leptolyngbya sp. SIOISBB]|nr:hypothetical protein [Leptolyngbya sp. SIOISBB]